MLDINEKVTTDALRGIETPMGEALDAWNKKNPGGQFIDTSGLILETETKKTKKQLLKEIYALKIDILMTKAQAFNDGANAQINADAKKIAEKEFIYVNANLQLHDKKDCIINDVDRLIRFAEHSEIYLKDCKRMALDLQKLHDDQGHLFDEITAFKMVTTRMALPDSYCDSKSDCRKIIKRDNSTHGESQQ